VTDDIPVNILDYPPQALHPLKRVALFLGRGPEAVRLLVQRGVIPSHRQGHIHYITTEAVRRYLEVKELQRCKKKNIRMRRSTRRT